MLEQRRICPRLSLGTEAVVPPPGGDSEIRTLPEVKEYDLLLLATSP